MQEIDFNNCFDNWKNDGISALPMEGINKPSRQSAYFGIYIYETYRIVLDTNTTNSSEDFLLKAGKSAQFCSFIP